MIRYAHPSQVQLSYLHNRPILSTDHKGYVALDAPLLAVWQYANGSSLEEISSGFHSDFSTPKFIRTALACLAEAGLLERTFDSDENESQALPRTELQPLPVHPQSTVSVVIVNYNSLEFLKACIHSLLAQTYSKIQIIVVDNGSFDGALDWLATSYPDVQRLQINRPASLSHGINAGVALASPANYLLILNPDVTLEPDAIAQMLLVASCDPFCAAVAPKLCFSWAPPFLNGLGNHVSNTSWGTDNAIGHLDLGQFNAYHELPSACFAAALITPKAWDAVGPMDEGFPMYYEDVEWCYRARLKGFKVLAAPKAVIFHAFGGSLGSMGHAEGIPPEKLANVVYGRQRFAIKLLDRYLMRFSRNFIAEDWRNFIRYFITRDFAHAKSYLRATSALLKTLPSILAERRRLQAGRVIADEALFKIQRDIPKPLVWNLLPELTWDLITDLYYPLIAAKKTRLLPEYYSQSHQHLLVINTGDAKEVPALVRRLIQSLEGKLDITYAIPITAEKSEIEFTESGGSGSSHFQQVVYPPDQPKSLQLLVENCDIAILPGELVSRIPRLQYAASRLVILLPAGEAYPNEAMDMGGVLTLGDFYISIASERSHWVEAVYDKGRTDVQVEYDLDTITQYCLQGRYAPDRDPRLAYPAPPPLGPSSRFSLMIYIWRTQGFRTMLQRTNRYINQHLLHSSQ